jgi:signal transduction histidine kinase
MDDVIGIPRRIRWFSLGAFFVYVAILWLVPPNLIALLAIPLVLGLLLALGYVVVIGIHAVRRTHGITQRRLIAVSLGSVFLALNFAAGRLPIAPEDARSLVDIFGVAAGISYYIGFAPPRWLRQLWQGPELRAFLVRSATLPQLADSVAMYQAIEHGAAAALGAPYASLGLWDEGSQTLIFPTSEASVALPLSADLPVIRAFRQQKAVFSNNVAYDPELDAKFRLQSRVRVALAAPVGIGAQRLGVLTVYGPRVAIFADDDLALLQFMADQTAMILEGHRLNERGALIRAREESTRLKEDFLSAAAHDLKTPLTTLIIQAQFSERRAARNPEAPADRAGLRRIAAQAERMRAMVLELLDAARADHYQLVGTREPVDLVACIRTVVERYSTNQHTFVVDAPARLIGRFDPGRIAQLLDNLAENAVKYSPAGGTITIRLRQEAALVQLTLTDQGIGVPPADLPHLFERFHRGANVDDRRFPGWGLGLSICRQIVEQHGGRITVNSQEGQGTTFHVTLPITDVEQEQYATAHPDR